MSHSAVNSREPITSAREGVKFLQSRGGEGAEEFSHSEETRNSATFRRCSYTIKKLKKGTHYHVEMCTKARLYRGDQWGDLG